MQCNLKSMQIRSSGGAILYGKAASCSLLHFLILFQWVCIMYVMYEWNHGGAARVTCDMLSRRLLLVMATTTCYSVHGCHRISVQPPW